MKLSKSEAVLFPTLSKQNHYYLSHLQDLKEIEDVKSHLASQEIFIN